jgi:ribosomal protein S18 acetylase RimI-like enzyme
MSWSQRLTIEPLSGQHDHAGFRSGATALDDYIGRQASQDVRRRVSQVFVATRPNEKAILGFYSLNAGSIEKDALPEPVAQRLPHYPVPVAVLGRLAVALQHQGSGLGSILLANACKRVIQASGDVAMMAIVVDAKDQAAIRFYERFGFEMLPGTERRMFLTLKTVHALLRT